MLRIEASNEDLRNAGLNLYFELWQPGSKAIRKYPMTPRGIGTGIRALSWQYPDRSGLPGLGAGPVGESGVCALIHDLAVG